jgi:hypothetical protein
VFLTHQIALSDENKDSGLSWMRFPHPRFGGNRGADGSVLPLKLVVFHGRILETFSFETLLRLHRSFLDQVR